MHHKTITTGLTLTCLLATVAAGPATTKPAAAEITGTVPADWTSHTAGDSGVTLKAPADWTEGTMPPGSNGKISLVPADGSGNVNLVVVPANGLTVQNAPKMLPGVLRQQFPSFKLVTADNVKVGRTSAARLVYTFTANGQSLKLCQFFFVQNGKQYVLTCAAVAKTYDALIAKAEAVAVSMKIPS